MVCYNVTSVRTVAILYFRRVTHGAVRNLELQPTDPNDAWCNIQHTKPGNVYDVSTFLKENLDVHWLREMSSDKMAVAIRTLNLELVISLPGCSLPIGSATGARHRMMHLSPSFLLAARDTVSIR